MTKSAVVVVLVSLAVPALAQPQRVPPAAAPSPPIAVRAGRLVDPDTGTAAANQVILVENGKITAVGGNIAIPAGAEVIDLTGQTVLPGLVGRGPQATDQTAVRPSVVPGPTAITVDTAAILAARVRADGSIDVFSTEVDKVCPTSRLECVPAPSQHQGSTLDLQGAKASTARWPTRTPAGRCSARA